MIESENIRLEQLYALCKITNNAWKKWFYMSADSDEKDMARLHYLSALNNERMLYDVIMQEDFAELHARGEVGAQADLSVDET